MGKARKQRPKPQGRAKPSPENTAGSRSSSVEPRDLASENLETTLDPPRKADERGIVAEPRSGDAESTGEPPVKISEHSRRTSSDQSSSKPQSEHSDDIKSRETGGKDDTNVPEEGDKCKSDTDEETNPQSEPCGVSAGDISTVQSDTALSVDPSEGAPNSEPASEKKPKIEPATTSQDTLEISASTDKDNPESIPGETASKTPMDPGENAAEEPIQKSEIIEQPESAATQTSTASDPTIPSSDGEKGSTEASESEENPGKKDPRNDIVALADSRIDTSLDATSDSPDKPQNPPNHDANLLPQGWSLEKLELELPLSKSENISCVSSHGSNLYIGTSRGQLLHLYLFDDADQYILILQIPVNESSEESVAKILIVPDADMVAILCGKTVYFFTLPELSPCRVGKIKDAEDISLLSVGKLPSDKNKSDKVIIYTLTKLRVVQVSKNGVKLLRDINYTGAKWGLSSATGTSAHYSNICLIANDKQYDVVDMQQARKIPLFDYNPAAVAGIRPLIIPFLAADLAPPKEEYLLSICTELSTSMAMFINSAGDVTRGTLTWIDLGYPQGGIVIEWPYAIGVFRHGGRTRLIFSSLESLEVVSSVDCAGIASLSGNMDSLMVVNSGSEIKVADMELSARLAKASYTSRSPVSPEKQFGGARTVLSDGTSLFFLQKQSELARILAEILSKVADSALADLRQYIEYFSTASDAFHHSMHCVLLLLTGEFTELKQIIEKSHNSSKVDPRLFMLYCDPTKSENVLWDTFQAETVFFEISDRLSGQCSSIPEIRAFYVWLIRETHSHSDAYDATVSTNMRKLVYTETCQNSQEVLTMIDAEHEIWSGQNAINDELTMYFESQNQFLVLLQIYTIKQNAGNGFEQWPLKIIDLCLALLSGHKTDKSLEGSDQKGPFTVGAHRFDLPEMAFHHLRENVTDEPTYAKKLLKLLQLSPERGLVLLKSAKGNKFTSTHKYILGELAKSYTFDAKFSLLKIDYSEQSFVESSRKNNKIDLVAGRELLDDYRDYLGQDNLQVEYENLSILYHTYMVENDLEDPVWPKITWIEYLHLHYRKSECEEFLKVYLKVYELVVLHSMYGQDFKFDIEPTHATIEFFHWIVGNEAENKFREIKDYSSAEWMVFYGHPPVPRTSFFLENFQENGLLALQKLLHEKVTENLTRLLKFYLILEEKARNPSIMHAVNAYGHYLTLDVILQLLPDALPLMYVEKYVSSQILELERRRTDVQIRKALHKADAKLNKTVLKDFDETQKRLGEIQ